jgi:hypothetical protein
MTFQAMVNDPPLGGINERIDSGSVTKNGREIKKMESNGS